MISLCALQLQVLAMGQRQKMGPLRADVGIKFLLCEWD